MFEKTAHDTPKVGRRDDDWWRGAVIYQIYPRSFATSAQGAPTGDLRGILGKLDHIASLGVDAIWISPFMKSPMADYGYDVADYCAVDPMFGTIEDFDQLLEAAHGRGLKVMIDFVPSHTSNEHPWFLESRSNRENPKADWYVWADAKDDGCPPNNWLAVFGGSTWEWEPRRGQYYLHNFLVEQPDLNFRNPDVIDALLAQARFWLDRGVDGFRVDAIDFGVHDVELRDNPARAADEGENDYQALTPFGRQVQLYNKARPELSDLFLKPLFRLSENYEGRTLLGEISGDTALERIAEYTDGGGLDIGYSFDLLFATDAKEIAGPLERLEAVIGAGWPCWSFSNHDVPRAVSRFGGSDAPDALRALLPQLLCSLRGSICLYQGEELGLEEAQLAFDDLQDPYGKTYWPAFAGRDGARTPMPWSAQEPAGATWLPVSASHRARAVGSQEGDPSSVLEQTRAYLHWRKTKAPLVRGDFAIVHKDEKTLGFTRSYEGETIYCLFNLGDAPATITLPEKARALDCPTQLGDIRGDAAHLPAHAALFAQPDG